MKKIDKLVLDAFLGPFLITFLVVVFILLNINMLKYFDDIIGKGLDYDLLAQLFFYFAIFTIPTALPLAVLLSSLIAYGNLGEHFELTAIKSSGVSLVRTLVPIFFFVVFLTGVAFHANNSLVPKAALEAYSLLYDIKQKKPALDLREGAFYNGINDISIKVNKKFPDGITLKDVMVYDHRKNDGNRDVTVADSGKMYSILNDRYLKFELFNGYNYTEGAATERELTGTKSRGKNTETLSRSKFSKTQVVFDLSSFDIVRTDKKWFQGNRIMRNLNELDGDIDSMRREILSQRLNNYQNFTQQFYYFGKGDTLIMPEEVYRHKLYRDSIVSMPFQNRAAPTPEPTQTSALVVESKTVVVGQKKDSAMVNQDTIRKKSTSIGGKRRKREELTKERFAQKSEAKVPDTKKSDMVTKVGGTETKAKALATAREASVTPSDSLSSVIDSLLAAAPTRAQFSAAANMARRAKSEIMNANSNVENFAKEQRTFEIQWHKIFASSFACIAMFLIGAPLGSIIKRGGLGVPFLVSILFFIVYYVLTMQGEKLAKAGTVSVEVGVWMADVILFGIGLFFLRQARVDARLFDNDSYAVAFDKIKRWVMPARAVS
jgi:lipopolysaccharide export system permease protein